MWGPAPTRHLSPFRCCTRKLVHESRLVRDGARWSFVCPRAFLSSKIRNTIPDQRVLLLRPSPNRAPISHNLAEKCGKFLPALAEGRTVSGVSKWGSPRLAVESGAPLHTGSARGCSSYQRNSSSRSLRTVPPSTAQSNRSFNVETWHVEIRSRQ